MKTLEELKNIDGVNRLSVENNYGMGIYVPENKINKENEDLINSSGYLSTEKVDNKTVYDIVNCSTRLPGDFEISKINLKEGSFDKKEAIKENGVILVRKSYYEEPGKKYELELTKYKDGQEISYSFVEDEVKGYEAGASQPVVDNDGNVTIVFTNYHELEKIDIPIEKEWDDAGNKNRLS